MRNGRLRLLLLNQVFEDHATNHHTWFAVFEGLSLVVCAFRLLSLLLGRLTEWARITPRREQDP